MKKKGNLLKNILTHTGAILLFLVISVFYFSPELDGKMLPQVDVTHYQGASEELRKYYEEDGQSSAWIGSMFSGMPAYQVGVRGGTATFLNIIEKPFRMLGDNMGPVFAGMVMAYILFLCMGVNPIIAMLGAIAYSLSSYNIIILHAGHVTKAWALAYLPLVVSSMMLLFRRKYLLAGLLLAIGLALQIKSNHLQISYYTAIFCAFIYIAFVVQRFVAKDVKGFLQASGFLAVGVSIAILCNMGSLYANYAMAEESTRGKSELSNPSASEKQSSGLDKDYAFAWSYGKAETLSLLIPDIHGGASGGQLSTSSNLYKALVSQGYGAQTSPNGIESYTYWGDQPFTSGPVYFGAIICFLFVLGMIIIRSRLKWVIFIATLFFIFLSWGRNMDWFNDIMFHYLPMYNKFRTVSMALIIPALSMIMIAIWGLKEFFSAEIDKAKLTKSLFISLAVTGGFALFFWIAPGFFFNFVSETDATWKTQMPDWYYNALLLDRRDLLSSDALRSLLFILVSGALLWFTLRMKEPKKVGILVSVGLVLLVMVDLWTIDKRYLNNDSFVHKSDYQTQTFQAQLADKVILEDKEPSHRVLKLGNPFNDAATSYFHKSIGGYHAAKLKRYQEMIDRYLQQEVAYTQQITNNTLKTEIDRFSALAQQGGQVNPNDIAVAIQDSVAPLLRSMQVMNMLNTKYIIFHNELPPLVNPYAYGCAWFVNDYLVVNNADQELDALHQTDLRKTAVVDKRFEANLSGLTLSADSTASIVMTEYHPNKLVYKAKVSKEQLVVFSEMYFANGWKAYVDDVPTEHFRADWTLRAMRIGAGEHTIRFEFDPDGYRNALLTANVCSGILFLLLIGSMVAYFVRRKKEEEI